METLYPTIAKHHFTGNKAELLNSVITTNINAIEITGDQPVIITDTENLDKLLHFYKESFSTCGFTLHANNKEEALLAVKHNTLVTLNGRTIDARKLSGVGHLLAQLSVAPKEKSEALAKSVLIKSLKNYPITTIENAVGAVTKANSHIKKSWAYKFSYWFIDNVKRSVLAGKHLSIQESIRRDWAPLVKLSDYLDGGIFLNASSTGSGKSENNQKLVEYIISLGMKVAFISHRRSIIDSSLVDVQGVTHYQHVKPGTEQDIQCLKIVVNSITKPNLKAFFSDVDLVILEEGKQVLEHLAIGTVKDRCDVFNQLKDICSNTKSLVVTDADINDTVLKFVSSAKPLDKVRLLHKKMDFSNKNVCLNSYKQVLGEIDQTITHQPMMICSDSKNQVDKLQVLYESKFPNLRILSIHRDNINGEKQQAFLGEPNEQGEEYDVIIYSPAITSSLNLTSKRFKLHFGLFKGIVCASTIIQMLRRNRSCDDFRVGVDQPHYYHEFNAEALLLESPTDFDKFSATIEAANNYNKAHIVAALYFLAKHEGFNVVLNENFSKESDGVMANFQARHLEESEYKKAILNCSVTTEVHYINFKRSKDQAVIYERSLIEKTMGKSDLMESDIDDWQRGKLQTKVENLELLRASRNDCIDADKKELLFAMRDKNFHVLKYDFFNVIFDTLGINKLTGKGEYTTEDATALIDLLMSSRKEFNCIKMGKTLPSSITKPMRTVNAVVRLFGLKPKCINRGANKNRKRDYYIDPESIYKMNLYLENRRIKAIKV
jgi:hypothetical protein